VTALKQPQAVARPHTRPAWDHPSGRVLRPSELAVPSAHERGFIRSFDALGPDDFSETFELEPVWCGECRLPIEACCCPEPDGEFDDLDEIGGGIDG
jgi:hypothetical protein